MNWISYVEHFNPLIIDIEATGGGRSDEIVEICLIDYLTEKSVFHHYVKPTINVNYHALKVHGLTNKFLKGFDSFHKLEPKLSKIIDQRLLIGYDIRLDQRVLNQTYERYGKIPPITAWLCAMQVFRKLYNFKQTPSLTKACEIANIVPGAHSADTDALATLRLIKKLTQVQQNA